jgi:hypothetical protein
VLVRRAQLQQQLQLLGEELVVVLQVVAEERERLDEGAAPGHDLGAAAGEQVERGEAWKTRTGSSELSTVTALVRRIRSVRRGGRQDHGRRGDDVVGTVVLADAEDVEAHLVGQLDLLHQVAHGAHDPESRQISHPAIIVERSVRAPDAVLTGRRASFMASKAHIVVLLLLPLAAAGCLRKETTHTLYVSPDGSVRWTVEEAGVYSDEADAGARFAEEQAYIGPALIGSHRVALGLQAIAPDSLVRTTVIRDERPFHVITEARFLRIDRALERLFKESGIQATAALDQTDEGHRLRMQFDFTRAVEERESPAAALLEDLENFRFVLTEGRFVAGGGFDVPDRTRAVLSRDWLAAVEKAMETRQTIDLALTWHD